MNDLPIELLFPILCFLPLGDIGALLIISKHMNHRMAKQIDLICDRVQDQITDMRRRVESSSHAVHQIPMPIMGEKRKQGNRALLLYYLMGRFDPQAMCLHNSEGRQLVFGDGPIQVPFMVGRVVDRDRPHKSKIHFWWPNEKDG